MKRFIRVLAILGIAGAGNVWSQVSAQTSAPEASAPAMAPRPAAVRNGSASDALPASAATLFVLQIDDVSGTMAPAINAVATSEAEQYQTSVRPDDTFLRVEFKCGARVSDLVELHTVADVGRLAQVLAQPRETRGDTCPADGLALAREVYVKEGGGRAAVLALTTDGEIDPRGVRTLDEERRRIESEAHWWREHAVARVLVAVDRGGASHRGLEFIAAALDARVVPLDQFAAARLIERQVKTARDQAVAVANADTTLVSQARGASRLPLPMAALATLLLVVLGVIRARRRRPRGGATTVATDTTPKLDGTAADVEITVTDRGRISRFTRTLQGDRLDQALTFAEAGTVAVAGLREPGVELSRDAESGELLLSVPPGVRVIVDGREAPGAGGTIPVRRGFTIRSVAFVSVVVTSMTAPIDMVGTAMTRGAR